jgi:hypothetical protein
MPALFSITALALLAGRTVCAENFQELADGGVRHTESGWLFPKAIGEYQRVGNPEEVAGTRDKVAKYERSTEGNRIAATVYVYPPDSRAEDAPLEGAKAVLVAGLKSADLAQLWSEGPFRAGKTPVLVGEKAFYKIGIGPDSSQTNLYYFDTGKWVVKIRMSPQKTEKDTFQSLDTFVRDQSWDSLELTTETCTGRACRADRPLAVHGALPEQLAMLLVNAKLKDVFPREMPACEAGALEAALAAPGPQQADGQPEPLHVAAGCAPAKGMKASFVRMTLSQEIRDKIELQSPDGLSLRDPLTFVVLSNGKNSIYTQMHDGPLDAASVARMLETLRGTRHMIFANADKRGKNAKPVIRFVGEM